jgi:uncharacterized protein (DUF362 family)
MSSNVAVMKTTPEKVLDDYSKLMRSCNYKKYLPKKKRTVLKLNLSWSLYYPACSTEPWQLEGVLKTLREDGYTDIVAMEHRTVVTNIAKGLVGNRWKPILKKYGVEFVPLPDVKWVNYDNVVKSDLPAIKAIFGNTHKIPEPMIGTNVLHLPTMKTHGHTTMTGAMKNAFGGLITIRRHHSHKIIHEILVDLLKIQKEIHTGMFVAMDGTVCGDGAGPRTMEPVIKNYIMAGDDSVAIDAVSAKMMGFDPANIKFIALADKLKLGNGRMENIKIIGEDISKVNFNFHTEESPVITWDKMFRKGKLRFLERLIFHTGIFNLAIFGSAFYHDRLWYPIAGKKRIEEFMKTEWGRKFSQY